MSMRFLKIAFIQYEYLEIILAVAANADVEITLIALATLATRIVII